MYRSGLNMVVKRLKNKHFGKTNKLFEKGLWNSEKNVNIEISYIAVGFSISDGAWQNSSGPTVPAAAGPAV